MLGVQQLDDQKDQYHEYREKTHEKPVLYSCTACLYAANTGRAWRQHQAGPKHKKLLAALQMRQQ